jgi:cytochrome b561
MASLAITAFVLFVLGGWRYYWAPQDVRAYTDLHPLLRPSGTVGNLLGITGLSLMVMMHVYCGFLGPVLITLHTSFKFNGLVSVAYWSMLLVVLSGFVGRYLYLRIPRSIRGRELSDAELATRAAELKLRLGLADLPATIASKVHNFEATAIPASEAETTWTGLVIGELRMKLRLFTLARLARDHENSSLIAENLALIAERAVLMRRIAYLKKTRRLFDLWRVYHKPLAILMVLIVVLHVGTAAYLGYGWALR